MAVPCVQVEKCEKCLNYYPAKSIHQCMHVIVKEQKHLRKILPAECKEKNTSQINLNNSDNDQIIVKNQDTVNDYNSTSCLISAIKDRRPLFDHTLPLSNRCESIKNKLWNEVHDELQGQFTIDELKKKWKYLKEKYVRERQKQKKNGLKVVKKSKWLHYTQLSFLEEVVTQFHDKKIIKNLDLNLDNCSEDSPQTLTAKDQNSKEKNDHNFQRLNGHKIARRSSLTELIDEPHDSDVAFGKYLVSLMKDLPISKRKKLQSQIITTVISAQDLD